MWQILIIILITSGPNSSVNTQLGTSRYLTEDVCKKLAKPINKQTTIKGKDIYITAECIKIES